MIFNKNRKGLATPEKGEVYGSTISHMADLYGLIGSDIPLAEDPFMIDEKRRSSGLVLKGCPMGASMPMTEDSHYMVVDRGLLKKMKFRKDQRFKADIADGWYRITDGKNEYAFRAKKNPGPRPRDINWSSLDLDFDLDPAVLKEMCVSEKKASPKSKDPPLVCFRSENGKLMYGVMNGKTDGRGFDQGPVNLTARDCLPPGRRSSYYPVYLLDGVHELTDDVHVNMESGGGPAKLFWKGPNYETTYLIAPYISNELDKYDEEGR